MQGNIIFLQTEIEGGERTPRKIPRFAERGEEFFECPSLRPEDIVYAIDICRMKSICRVLLKFDRFSN